MGRTIEERRAYQREYYKKRKAEVGEYYRKTRKDYYNSNKTKYAERSKAWYESVTNKLTTREKKHGIDFWGLYNLQNGKCAVGGEALPENLDSIHVDHDHQTGYIRGLLCRPHNIGLGMFGDDWELLEKASQYVFKGKVRYLNDQA